MNRKIKILVAWSGGKDSQATLIWAAKKYGPENIEAVFCDTGWENPLTYIHVKEICELLGVKLTVIKSSKYDGMIDLAKKKKRFPSLKARFCTEELKVKPMIDYVLSLQQHVMILQGIRAEESDDRAKMNPECWYFKYYFEPYTDNNMKLAKLNKVLEKKLSKGKVPTTKQILKKKHLIDRLAKGKLDEKRFTYRKKEVVAFKEKFINDIYRPFFNQTAIEVINYILEAGQTPNPLYYRGRKRVGCDPCIMCGHGEMKEIISEEPDQDYDVLQKIRDGEVFVGTSFFGPDYIPDRFTTGIDENGKKFPLIDDVIHYLKKKQTSIFDMDEDDEDENPRRCMSAFNICE